MSSVEKNPASSEASGNNRKRKSTEDNGDTAAGEEAPLPKGWEKRMSRNSGGLQLLSN